MNKEMIKFCAPFINALEDEQVILNGGGYLIEGSQCEKEIYYCPFCGKELEDYTDTQNEIG